MTLAQRISALITSIGADVKALYARMGWADITATLASSTATVACGTISGSYYCEYTTSSNVTINVTGSGKQEITLLITLSGTATLALQFNGVTGNVKWPGGQTGSFLTTSGSVYLITGFANGTTLRVRDYQLQS